MKNYILLIGLPATGKSTYLKNLKDNSDRDFISIGFDDYLAYSYPFVAYNQAYREFQTFPKRNMHLYKMWLKEQIEQATKDKIDIFIDATNLTPQQRKGHLKRMPKGYRAKAIVFKKPDDKVWKEALSSRVGKTIPKDALIRMRASYIEPTIREGFNTIIKVPAFFS